MKKIAVLIIAVCLASVLSACSAQLDETTADDPSSNGPAESQPDEQEAATENDDSNTSSEEKSSKILVAYFSCTGNTEGIASYIVTILDADAYEIMPEEPYTSADLNYNDSSTRATVEQNDSSARPAISGSVENMEDYDIIFLGYPIWWGQAPKIIYTFVESYDFSGKMIVPFCTSGSSGVGSSATNLHNSAVGAEWLDGSRFPSNATQSDIEEWISGLGLKLSAE